MKNYDSIFFIYILFIVCFILSIVYYTNLSCKTDNYKSIKLLLETTSDGYEKYKDNSRNLLVDINNFTYSNLYNEFSLVEETACVYLGSVEIICEQYITSKNVFNNVKNFINNLYNYETWHLTNEIYEDKTLVNFENKEKNSIIWSIIFLSIYPFLGVVIFFLAFHGKQSKEFFYCSIWVGIAFGIILLIIESLLYVSRKNIISNYENFILEYTGLKNKDDTFLKKNKKLMGFDLGLIIIFSFEIILSFVFYCVELNCEKKEGQNFNFNQMNQMTLGRQIAPSMMNMNMRQGMFMNMRAMRQQFGMNQLPQSRHNQINVAPNRENYGWAINYVL